MNASVASTNSTTKNRLEAALNNGSNAEQLILDIVAICGNDTNATWEVLALVDQYYRRGRVSSEVFRGVRFQLQSLALGRPAAANAAPQVPPPPPPKTPVAQPAPIRTGRVLRDRYVLESPIDYGSADSVYRALDRYRADLPELQQRVAVRFPKQAGGAHREFFRAQPLAHPNIARVLEFDRDGDLAYYTIELLQGKLLRDVLEELPTCPLPMAEALSIVRDVGAAVAYAHEHNVVHGALDTKSVFISSDGRVRVLNFDSSLTEALRPEPRDDLNALASLAYELLAGRQPFQGHSLTVARQLGLRAKRPSGLSGPQWRALQQGLAWSRKHKVLQVKDWLPQLELQRAAATLPPLAELLATKPRSGWSMTALAVYLLAAATATLVAVAVIDPPALRAGYARLHATAVTPANRAPAAAVAASRAAEAAVAPPSEPEIAANPAPIRVNAVRISVPAATVTDNPSGDTPVAAADTAPAADERPGRISFLTDSFIVPEEAAAARIMVRRSSGIHGDISFSWWTENGSAKAGEDFIVTGNQHEVIPDGVDSLALLVPLISTPRPPGRAEFYVSLGSPSGGATLGGIPRVTVIVERP